MLILSNTGPYLLIATSLLASGIGLFVLLHDARDRTYRSFFLFTIGMSAWCAGIALLYLTNNFLFDKLAFAGGFALFAGLTSLAWSFPENRRFSKRFLLSLLPLAIGFVLVPFNVYISGIIVDPNGMVQPVNGPALPLFIAIIIGYGAASLILFGKSFLRSSGVARVQMSYLFGGILVFFVCLLTFDAVLPFIGIYWLNLLGPLSSLLFVASTAYAIIRHQLMDIRVVIQRGLIYTVLLSLIVVLYVSLINAFGLILDRDEGIVFSVGISTTLIGIFGVPVIERYFRRMTDKIFFKDRYDYASALQSLSEILHTSIDFDELIARMQENLAKILRARSAEIILRGEENTDALEKVFKYDIEERRKLYERIHLDSKQIGSILVHEKRSGERYTKGDEQLLRTFSLQASTALARAQLFKQVQEHALELENKVASRTRELRETQENQKQMMLDIAHNLQTPLAVFQTKLEKLRSGRQSGINVDTFEQSLMSLSDFIDDLLKLSELERQTAQKHFDRVSLSALVEEIAEEVEVIATSRGICVTCNIAPNIEITGDVKELRAAIMNLASNAIKYVSPFCKQQITFQLIRKGKDVCLSIRDTGIGISAEDLPHIFNRFYRMDNSDGIGGSGLGLAISKKIFERHGATLVAKSVIGEGTEMTVTFPV